MSVNKDLEVENAKLIEASSLDEADTLRHGCVNCGNQGCPYCEDIPQPDGYDRALDDFNFFHEQWDDEQLN